MAALGKPATQSNTKVYVALAKPTVTTLATFKSALAIAANLLKDPDNLGDAAQNANVTDIPVWGTDVPVSIAGPASYSPMAVSVLRDYSNALHTSIAGAAIGADVFVGLLSADGSDEAAVLVSGTIASKTRVGNDPTARRLGFEVAISNVEEFV